MVLSHSPPPIDDCPIVLVKFCPALHLGSVRQRPLTGVFALADVFWACKRVGGGLEIVYILFLSFSRDFAPSNRVRRSDPSIV